MMGSYGSKVGFNPNDWRTYTRENVDTETCIRRMVCEPEDRNWGHSEGMPTLQENYQKLGEQPRTDPSLSL